MPNPASVSGNACFGDDRLQAWIIERWSFSKDGDSFKVRRSDVSVQVDRHDHCSSIEDFVPLRSIDPKCKRRNRQACWTISVLAGPRIR
jgi:hypothetical protein